MDAAARGSQITLSRRDARDCGQRQVFVRVDDDISVVLAFGESETIPIEPGAHVLRVHNTLFRKRIEFTITPAERVEFNIINAAPAWSGGLATVLGWAPLRLTIEERRTTTVESEKGREGKVPSRP